MSIAENIRVEFDSDGDDALDLARLEKLICDICREFDLLDVTVQVSIVDDERMSELHHRFLNESSVTDVMSFDLSDEFEPGRNLQIVVNRQQAARQAEQRGHDTLCELALYITHGLLHQVGYDDGNPEQAKQMHETEDAILQTGGFGVIYHHDEK